jgi:hypothetical protein
MERETQATNNLPRNHVAMPATSPRAEDRGSKQQSGGQTHGLKRPQMNHRPQLQRHAEESATQERCVQAENTCAQSRSAGMGARPPCSDETGSGYDKQITLPKIQKVLAAAYWKQQVAVQSCGGKPLCVRPVPAARRPHLNTLSLTRTALLSTDRPCSSSRALPRNRGCRDQGKQSRG